MGPPGQELGLESRSIGVEVVKFSSVCMVDIQQWQSPMSSEQQSFASIATNRACIQCNQKNGTGRMSRHGHLGQSYASILDVYQKSISTQPDPETHKQRWLLHWLELPRCYIIKPFNSAYHHTVDSHHQARNIVSCRFSVGFIHSY